MYIAIEHKNWSAAGERMGSSFTEAVYIAIEHKNWSAAGERMGSSFTEAVYIAMKHKNSYYSLSEGNLFLCVQ